MPPVEEPCPKCGGRMRELELVDKRDRGSGRSVPQVECNQCHRQYRWDKSTFVFVRDRPKPGG